MRYYVGVGNAHCTVQLFFGMSKHVSNSHVNMFLVFWLVSFCMGGWLGGEGLFMLHPSCSGNLLQG